MKISLFRRKAHLAALQAQLALSKTQLGLEPSVLAGVVADATPERAREALELLLRTTTPLTDQARGAMYRLMELAESSPTLPNVSPLPSMLAAAVDEWRRIRKEISRNTATFVRTTPFASVVREHERVEFDIRDLLLIAAVSHADVLMTGRTGSGKTKLATGIVSAIFGPDQVFTKTTLPGMSPSDFADIDFRAIKEGTKTLQQAISAVPALTKPGVILNEANRAPASVQSMLIPFLDREFEVEGKPVPVGVEDRGERYQFRVITINEGDEYDVEPFDPALRDRAVVQIPVDLFPQSEGDVEAMVRQLSQPVPAEELPSESSLNAVLKIRDAAMSIPLDEDVSLFLVYLSGLSNCHRSPTGYKEGIRYDAAEHCRGCHHATHGNVCGNVRAPSPRALVNLIRVGQGVALARCAKSIGVTTAATAEPVVTREDLLAIAPFVLRGKLGFSDAWLRTATIVPNEKLKGSEWEAIRMLMKIAIQRFDEFLSSEAYFVARAERDGASLEVEDLRFLARWSREKDIWCANPVRLDRLSEHRGSGAS